MVTWMAALLAAVVVGEMAETLVQLRVVSKENMLASL
jgi:hypothetical protein